MSPFFVSYTKSLLDFGREPSQFPNFSALEGLVSYKSVSYKKSMCISNHFCTNTKREHVKSTWHRNGGKELIFQSEKRGEWLFSKFDFQLYTLWMTNFTYYTSLQGMTRSTVIRITYRANCGLMRSQTNTQTEK